MVLHGKSVLHSCLLFMFAVLSFFLSGILVFVVILFLIVPINLAIDDAPNRLLNINQTILVFTILSQSLYQSKSSGTILDQLVKANTKKLKPTPLPLTDMHSTYRPGHCNYGHSTYRPGRCNYRHSTYRPTLQLQTLLHAWPLQLQALLLQAWTL